MRIASSTRRRLRLKRSAKAYSPRRTPRSTQWSSCVKFAPGRSLADEIPEDQEIGNFIDLEEGTKVLDLESRGHLDALKRQLRDRLGPTQVKTYTAYWVGDGPSTGHIPRLCIDVYKSLRRLIHTEIARMPNCGAAGARRTPWLHGRGTASRTASS